MTENDPAKQNAVSDIAGNPAPARVWLEAEAFHDLGGWVIDSQSLQEVGSAYIMAHGMGVPVRDAVTTCHIPKAGQWTVWVRTRDWTAVWKRGTPAGRFQVGINDMLLPETLGTNGEAWAWQKAGVVALNAGEAKIALHDLTGFNGRCDALFLTTGPDDVPPNEKDKLAQFRRQVAGTVCQTDSARYDLVVVGGGIAGICTAIAAMRTGSKVILVEERAVLGGSNSSEVRVGLGGSVHAGLYPNLGKIVDEIAPVTGSAETYPQADIYEDSRKELIFRNHPDSRLVLNERLVAVEKDPRQPDVITAIVTYNNRTGTETRYQGKLFADCSGHALIARLVGAEVMYGREARSKFNESLAPEKRDNLVMGVSVLWCSQKADKPTAFPDVDWGIEFNEATAYADRGGEWEWETGQYRNQATEMEYIRDYGMMAIYANWSFLKNHSQRKSEWTHDTLAWVSPIGGKRESYRVVGDYILNQNDLDNHVHYPDATASITWSIDIHFPDPENESKFPEPFRSCAYHRGIGKPYPVPYRCLYARDVKNLFLGGRHISMSRIAFSSVRVQRTLGMLGEVIGMAASLCVRENATPHDIYEKHFDKLQRLMETGVPTPAYHAYDCDTTETVHFKERGQIVISNYHEFEEHLKSRTKKTSSNQPNTP